MSVQPEVWKLDSRRALPVVVASLAEGAERFGVRIVFYRIESDRLLLVVEAENRSALKRGMQGFGIRLSKAMNRLMGTRGSIFKERYHLQILQEPDEAQSALLGVLQNGHPSPRPRVGKLVEPKTGALRAALASTRVRRAAAAIPSIPARPPKRRPTA